MLFILFSIALTTYKVLEARDVTSCEEYNDIKEFARCEVTKQWSEEEYGAFYTIIQKESNWISTAKNPNSSAYGLPQALAIHDLPHDYKENPQAQILWAISYIDSRYGSASKALEFHRRNNFY